MGNYLDGADDLYQRKLIDRDFFLGRQGNAMKFGASVLRKFKDIVPGRFYDEDLISRLDKMVRTFEQTHGTRFGIDDATSEFTVGESGPTD